MSSAMIAMTTSSSMSVNPRQRPGLMNDVCRMIKTPDL